MVYAPFGEDKKTWPTREEYWKEMLKFFKTQTDTGKSTLQAEEEWVTKPEHLGSKKAYLEWRERRYQELQRRTRKKTRKPTKRKRPKRQPPRH